MYACTHSFACLGLYASMNYLPFSRCSSFFNKVETDSKYTQTTLSLVYETQMREKTPQTWSVSAKDIYMLSYNAMSISRKDAFNSQ